MCGAKDAKGWLIALRRFGAGGAMLFALVFVVGLLRGEAVALAAGDDLCVFMGGNLPPRLPIADPTDPADPSHDCCDLGLCLTVAAAPPPTAPAVALVARAVLRLRRVRRTRFAAPATKRHRALPRGPPVASPADAIGRGARAPAASRREVRGPVSAQPLVSSLASAPPSR